MCWYTHFFLAISIIKSTHIITQTRRHAHAPIIVFILIRSTWWYHLCTYIYCRFDVEEQKKICLPQNVWDVQRFSFQMNLNLCFSTPFVQLFSEQQLHSIIILIYSHSFSSAALFFWLNEEREKINKEIVFVILMSRMCVCVTNSVENLYNILRWLEFPRIRTHMQSKLHT